MEPESDSKKGENQKGCLQGLRILLAIYAGLYLIFITDNFIPGSGFNPWNSENIAIKLMFAVFVIGYIISWRNQLAAGVIFILWFGGMCYLDLVISYRKSGDGIGMGLPLLIMGILMIVYSRKKIT